MPAIPSLGTPAAVALVLALMVAEAPSASAQERWPARRVTLVVPFGAGSITDVLARMMADHYKDALGQPFIVENRGGAGGTLGANAVARAAPDGYTLLYGGNTTHSAAPAFMRSVPYDPLKDFTPIARIARYSSVLVSNPMLPFRTIQEMVGFARANPGKLTYGHGNSTGQIVGETMKKRLGLDIARLAYPSTAPAMVDVLSGTTQLMIADIVQTRQHMQEGGKLVALATLAKPRSALMTDVPTLHETVMPGFEVLPWVGLFGPPGLPAEVVQRMAAATDQFGKRADTAQRLGNLSAEPFFAGSGELVAYVRDDMPRWAAAAREAGIDVQ